MKRMRFQLRDASWLLVIASVLFWTRLAEAHPQPGQAAGFTTGFLHPWSGVDHLLAMIAVGIWGAQLGAPAIWILPVTFPMVMAVGGFLGLVGINLPRVEFGVALSALLLGVAVCAQARPNLVFAMILVGCFGLYHGHAHSTELPPGQSGLLYSLGFVIATGSLHAIGISLGLVNRWPIGNVALRAGGAFIALMGAYFVWGAFA
jgi:urease accessory protein